MDLSMIVADGEVGPLLDRFVNVWIVPEQLNVPPWLYVITALTALFLFAVSKGGFGGGVGILAVPLLLQVAPPQFVLVLLMPVLMACDLATVRQYPKKWDRRAVFMLAPGMLLGMAAAAFLLSGMNAEPGSEGAKTQAAWLNLSIGLIALVFIVLKFLPSVPRSASPWRPTWAVSLPVGAVAGFSNLLANASGTVLTLFLLPLRLEPPVFVATCGWYYLIFNLVKIPYFWAIGLLTFSTLKYALWLILLAPCGVWLGVWLNRRISAKWFVRVVYGSLILASGKLLYDWLRFVTA